MREELIDEIHRVFDELTTSLSQVPAAKFNEVPFPGSWTPGQLARHLLKSYDAILETLIGKTADAGRPADARVALIRRIFQDHGSRLEAPGFIVPESQDFDQELQLEQFAENKLKLEGAAELLDLSAICLDLSLPRLGELTRLEWIWFIIYHTQRHLGQLTGMAGEQGTKSQD